MTFYKIHIWLFFKLLESNHWYNYNKYNEVNTRIYLKFLNYVSLTESVHIWTYNRCVIPLTTGYFAKKQLKEYLHSTIFDFAWEF